MGFYDNLNTPVPQLVTGANLNQALDDYSKAYNRMFGTGAGGVLDFIGNQQEEIRKNNTQRFQNVLKGLTPQDLEQFNAMGINPYTDLPGMLGINNGVLMDTQKAYDASTVAGDNLSTYNNSQLNAYAQDLTDADWAEGIKKYGSAGNFLKNYAQSQGMRIYDPGKFNQTAAPGMKKGIDFIGQQIRNNDKRSLGEIARNPYLGTEGLTSTIAEQVAQGIRKKAREDLTKQAANWVKRYQTLNPGATQREALENSPYKNYIDYINWGDLYNLDSTSQTTTQDRIDVNTADTKINKTNAENTKDTVSANQQTAITQAENALGMVNTKAESNVSGAKADNAKHNKSFLQSVYDSAVINRKTALEGPDLEARSAVEGYKSEIADQILKQIQTGEKIDITNARDAAGYIQSSAANDVTGQQSSVASNKASIARSENQEQEYKYINEMGGPRAAAEAVVQQSKEKFISSRLKAYQDSNAYKSLKGWIEKQDGLAKMQRKLEAEWKANYEKNSYEGALNHFNTLVEQFKTANGSAQVDAAAYKAEGIKKEAQAHYEAKDNGLKRKSLEVWEAGGGAEKRGRTALSKTELELGQTQDEQAVQQTVRDAGGNDIKAANAIDKLIAEGAKSKQEAEESNLAQEQASDKRTVGRMVKNAGGNALDAQAQLRQKEAALFDAKANKVRAQLSLNTTVDSATRQQGKIEHFNKLRSNLKPRNFEMLPQTLEEAANSSTLKNHIKSMVSSPYASVEESMQEIRKNGDYQTYVNKLGKSELETFLNSEEGKNAIKNIGKGDLRALQHLLNTASARMINRMNNDNIPYEMREDIQKAYLTQLKGTKVWLENTSMDALNTSLAQTNNKINNLKNGASNAFSGEITDFSELINGNKDINPFELANLKDATKENRDTIVGHLRNIFDRVELEDGHTYSFNSLGVAGQNFLIYTALKTRERKDIFGERSKVEEHLRDFSNGLKDAKFNENKVSLMQAAKQFDDLYNLKQIKGESEASLQRWSQGQNANQ